MKDLQQYIINNLFERFPNLLPQKNNLLDAFNILVDCYQNNGKVLTCGNGGSASDSEHIVGELMKGFILKRPLSDIQVKSIADTNLCDDPCEFSKHLQQGLPAISLVSQTSIITAFLNDVEPNMIFAQQSFAYGNDGDVLIGLSTSGNSKNVVNAAIAAKAKKMKVISFTGQNNSELSKISDVCFNVPSNETFIIQELHLPLYHALCSMVEQEIYDC